MISCYFCRAQLEDLVSASQDWCNKAAAILNNNTNSSNSNSNSNVNNTPLTIDELKEFITLSNKNILNTHTHLVTELKSLHKVAKNWKLKFDKSGYDTPTADKEYVAELLAEAKTINVNLTEFTENLAVLTKTYCLCRQLYFGVMVGCDTCNEWYHFSCINLTAIAAEKCDTYICLRCALNNSFNYSAELVGNITNKWMVCSEHFKQREAHLQKVRVVVSV